MLDNEQSSGIKVVVSSVPIPVSPPNWNKLAAEDMPKMFEYKEEPPTKWEKTKHILGIVGIVVGILLICAIFLGVLAMGNIAALTQEVEPAVYSQILHKSQTECQSLQKDMPTLMKDGKISKTEANNFFVACDEVSLHDTKAALSRMK